MARHLLARLDRAASGGGAIDWAGNVFLLRGDRDRLSVIEDEDMLGRPDRRSELPTPELR